VTFPHALHPEARIEALEGMRWYESRRSGLGRDFKNALIEALVNAVPLAVVDEGFLYRKVLVRDFPYTVVLLEEYQGGSLVIAVAHQRRRPGYWKSRVNKDAASTP